jgi:uncharacterized protein
MRLRKKSWSPHVVGVGLGVLSWFAFLTVDHGLGITTAVEHTAAISAQAVAPPLEQNHAYFLDHTGEKSPKIGWEWFLVLGVLIGAYASSKLSGDRPKERVPGLWRARFGSSTSKRYAGAFAGGLLLIFGARLAQGCTSGHGITGALQLAVSSWTFLATFFVTGVVVAMLVYGRGGDDDVRTSA